MQAAAAALAEAGRCTGRTRRQRPDGGQAGLALLDELLPGGSHRILTHCNTGALVSGGEGTAFAVALAAHRAGRLRRLWVDETRPLLQGARLTAYEAARNGMAYTLLTDNAAGSLFAAGEVDAVLIGADRIAADGSVANKVGSYPLAVLATLPPCAVRRGRADHDDRPGHARRCVDRGGAARGTGGDEFMAGMRAGGMGRRRHPIAPLGTQAYNPAFDVTPPELVTAIVTEYGVLSPVTGTRNRRTCVPGHDRQR